MHFGKFCRPISSIFVNYLVFFPYFLMKFYILELPASIDSIIYVASEKIILSRKS